MSACKFSSKNLASKAGKTLVSKVGSVLDKSLAGSVLSQTPLKTAKKSKKTKAKPKRKTTKTVRKPYQPSLFSSFFDYGTQQKSF